MQKQVSIEGKADRAASKAKKWKQIDELKDKIALEKLLAPYEFGDDYFNNVV